MNEIYFENTYKRKKYYSVYKKGLTNVNPLKSFRYYYCFESSIFSV